MLKCTKINRENTELRAKINELYITVPTEDGEDVYIKKYKMISI